MLRGCHTRFERRATLARLARARRQAPHRPFSRRRHSRWMPPEVGGSMVADLARVFPSSIDVSSDLVGRCVVRCCRRFIIQNLPTAEEWSCRSHATDWGLNCGSAAGQPARRHWSLRCNVRRRNELVQRNHACDAWHESGMCRHRLSHLASAPLRSLAGGCRVRQSGARSCRSAVIWEQPLER
jgi:hypothetical protein